MKRFLAFILFCGLAHGQSMLSLMAASGGTGGGAGSFLHSRSLTVDHNQVGTADLTNYPVYVSLTLGSGKIQNASCFDVVFAADSGNTTARSWETEPVCNTGTGVFAAHVKVPSISHTVDTVFYVFYDNAAITTFQSVGSVWDANFLTVMHFPDGTSLSANDSAGGHNGTLVGTFSAAAGLMDGGASSIASTVAVTFPSAGLNLNTGTVSMWVDFQNASSGGGTSYFFDSDTTRHAFIFISTLIEMFNDGRVTDFVGPTWGAATWHHLAFLYNKTGNIQRLFFDGAEVTGGVPSGTWGSTALGANAYLGNRFSVNSGMAGTYEEMRVSNVIRPDGWYLADFNSQKAGATFVTVGSEI